METIRPSRADAQVKIDFRRGLQTHGGTVESRRRAVKRHALHAMRITQCVSPVLQDLLLRVFSVTCSPKWPPGRSLQDMNNIIKTKLKKPPGDYQQKSPQSGGLPAREEGRQRIAGAIKNPGRGVGTAGIARKWEGERRIQANPVVPLSVHFGICLPDREDVRFNIGRGK